MSEIASKANARLTSNLTQPLVKKDDAAADKMLFAALFGSGVVAEDVADPMVGGLAPVNAESDTDANQHGNADILAATQAVAMMVRALTRAVAAGSAWSSSSLMACPPNV